jgi:hypothetical protein
MLSALCDYLKNGEEQLEEGRNHWWGRNLPFWSGHYPSLLGHAHWNLPQIRNRYVSSHSWNITDVPVRPLSASAFPENTGNAGKSSTANTLHHPNSCCFLWNDGLVTLLFNRLGYPLSSFLVMVAL